MSKRILATAVTAAALALTACGGGAENNVATENVEDLNATEDMNMDLNADVNMDANATDANATDEAAANEAADSTANSN